MRVEAEKLEDEFWQDLEKSVSTADARTSLGQLARYW
jgi:hypothetical protein